MSGVSPTLFQRFLREPARLSARALELVFGPVFVSAPVRLVRNVLWRTAPEVPKGLSAAMVAHVHYREMWPEVLQVWRTLPPGSPLFVTTGEETAQALDIAEADAGLIHLRPMPNRGRDIAPFLALLNGGELDRFDAVLKVHSKRSGHLRGGELRRRLLFAMLAGNAGLVRAVLNQFADERIGMVGPRLYFRTQSLYWQGNQDRVAALCAAMRPPAQPQLGFFEGSMMWLRPRALAPLRSLALTQEDFEEEAGQLDGALHHAVERCLSLAVLAAGCQIHGVDGRVLVAKTCVAL